MQTLAEKLLSAAAIATLSLSTTAHSQQLDCANRIIDRGDAVTELLDACGEPTVKDGNVWVYERDNRQTMSVTVREGVIESISDLDG